MNKKALTVAAFISLSASCAYQMSAADASPFMSSPSIVQSADVYNHLRSLLADYCEVSESVINMDTRLDYDLGLDSLDMLNISSLIYFEFNVDIPYTEFSAAKTVADVYDLIINHS